MTRGRGRKKKTEAERREEQEAREEEEAEAEAEGFHERLQKDIGASLILLPLSQKARADGKRPFRIAFPFAEGDDAVEEEAVPEATSLRNVSLDKWFDTAIKVRPRFKVFRLASS